LLCCPRHHLAFCTHNTTQVLADPKDADGYCASLEALGDQLRERTAPSGGVALATSSVTFHHLPSEAMRRCVYAFLYRVLGERGTAAWSKAAV
tara:strand:- start:616 stop:894 length:279 start_codon:yes stop_codon:yes gene_type:complete